MIDCPYCEKTTSLCGESLPKEQETTQLVGCDKCGKVFALGWEISYIIETMEENLDSLYKITPEYLEEYAYAKSEVADV